MDISGGQERIGITTTVPVEVVYAAGLVPVDLNNLFIAAQNPLEYVEEAERAGFPRNSCAWIKGIYSACRRAGIRRVVGVVHGDCSNTVALLEILNSEGVEAVEFAYPLERTPEAAAAAIQRFAARLGTTLAAAEEWRKRLEPVRVLLAELDRLSWESDRVTSKEAHLWMVSSSDFRGDPQAYGRELAAFLDQARARPAPSPALRLALAGVPPIAADFFEEIARLGARLVYNEVPAEFTMMRSANTVLQDIYCNYTYPYNTFYRLKRLGKELDRRRPRGLIHYLQSFCHRQIQGRLLKERLPIPVLSLECDRPGPMDGAARNRLESFVEMLKRREAEG